MCILRKGLRLVLIACFLVVLFSFGTARTVSAQPMAAGDSFDALAYAPSVSIIAERSGQDRDNATQRALKTCKESSTYYSNYQGDCRVAVWVRNGFVAFASDHLPDPGTYTAPWGTGWGHDEQEAKFWAAKVCKDNGGASCGAVETYRSPAYDQNGDTTGGGG